MVISESLETFQYRLLAIPLKLNCPTGVPGRTISDVPFCVGQMNVPENLAGHTAWRKRNGIFPRRPGQPRKSDK